MTDIISVEPTAATEAEATTATQVTTATAATVPTAQDISLQTAIKILRTIRANIGEQVYFWAAKNAYSGVYRTAVKNGWITDGLFVTDIPEGVDGGFLGADMRRVALMAELLASVLEDNLTSPAASTAGVSAEEIHAIIDARVGEYLASLDLETLRDTLVEVRDEFEDLVDEAREEIEAAKADAIGAIADAAGDAFDGRD